jgi:glycosyltransferase involved in cell wall biosynthesis
MTSDIKQLERLPLGNLQLKYLLKKMDYLVAVSKTSGKEFVEIGYPESRIAYISNGVQVLPNNRIAYAQVTSVLTTARLSREKGIDVLLKAWANVSQHEKTLRLIILGDGPLEPELRRLSETLGIMGSVEFAGMVHNVSKYLKETHLFILPSRTEGVSNALLEAMSHGIPCIATHVGGNAEALGIEEYKNVPKGEYIIGKNGLLVNPDDVKGLSEATLFLIQDGRLREEMGRSSRRFIQENYSIDLVADRYIALYKRMLERRD